MNTQEIYSQVRFHLEQNPHNLKFAKKLGWPNPNKKKLELIYDHCFPITSETHKWLKILLEKPNHSIHKNKPSLCELVLAAYGHRNDLAIVEEFKQFQQTVQPAISLAQNFDGKVIIEDSLKIPQKITKAISVKQPFAWAIFHAGKDVENRAQSLEENPEFGYDTNFRGRVYIHTGKKIDPTGVRWIQKNIKNNIIPEIPPIFALEKGVILGSVEIYNCIKNSASPWAIDGQWHFMLRNPVLLENPIPYNGKLGFFNIDINSNL